MWCNLLERIFLSRRFTVQYYHRTDHIFYKDPKGKIDGYGLARDVYIHSLMNLINIIQNMDLWIYHVPLKISSKVYEGDRYLCKYSKTIKASCIDICLNETIMDHFFKKLSRNHRLYFSVEAYDVTMFTCEINPSNYYRQKFECDIHKTAHKISRILEKKITKLIGNRMLQTKSFEKKLIDMIISYL
jgi:hypothetical protein